MPKYNGTLTSHLIYQLLTRVVVFLIAVIIQVAFQTWGWTAVGVSQVAFIIPLALILFSIFYSIVGCIGYRTVGNSVLPTQLVNKVSGFPVIGLALDFVALTVLVALTGGVDSVFLPIYLIALLVGDISLETKTKRTTITYVFIVSVILGIILPTLDGFQSLAFSKQPPGTSFGSSLWDLPLNVRIITQFIIFLAGALFGSTVLRRYVEFITSDSRVGSPSEKLESASSQESR